jgi:hypothetical protein
MKMVMLFCRILPGKTEENHEFSVFLLSRLRMDPKTSVT